MVAKKPSKIPEIIKKYENQILAEWVKEQLAATTLRPDLISEAGLRKESKDLLGSINQAVQTGNLTDISAPEWDKTRKLLSRISQTRVEQGFSPTETATFVLSLKQPLFARLRKDVPGATQMADEVWVVTVFMDQLGLYTTEQYLKMREQIIQTQKQDILELSTPVVKLWDGVLAVPLIGVLDSDRTQKVMENLLQQIVDTGSEIAIIDITGVPTVDTLVAQHLLKTVTATRLMGADCIISGVSPAIAQTMVQLGVSFDVVTKSSLAGALKDALQRLGKSATTIPNGS
jgi:rsbT co-antagonist protein RsbR